MRTIRLSKTKFARDYCVPAFSSFVILFFFSLTVSAQPVISGILPGSAPVGTSVVISGSGFGNSPVDNIVFFGGMRAAVSAASPTSLTVNVPTGASSKPVTVTTNRLTAYSSVPFRVTYTGTDSAFLATSFAPRIGFGLGSSGIYNPFFQYDLDGDGKLDLIAADHSYGSGLITLRNRSAPGIIGFSDRTTFYAGGSCQAGAVGDFDGDGKPDVAVSTMNEYQLSIFRNASVIDTIRFAPRIDFKGLTAPISLVCEDFDGDGRPDLIGASSPLGPIDILRNTTANGIISFDIIKNYPGSISGQLLSAGDVDDDGKPDLLIANVGARSVSVLRNTSSPGTISFATKVDFNTGENPGFVAVGDLNGDGKPELVVNNSVSFTVSVLRNISSTGSILFANKLDLALGTPPLGIDLEDLDGDGDLDIVTANYSANTVSVFKNTSGGGQLAFSPKLDLVTNSTPRFVALGDLDGDGKPDITSGNGDYGSVSVIRNTANAPAPVSFSPASGYIGSTITVTGINLSRVTAVSVGGVAATSFTVLSPTKITAVVGNAASGSITVTSPDGTGTLAGFVYLPPPFFVSFTPLVATQGSSVLITGSSFGTIKKVSFGGVPATLIRSVSSTSVLAVVGEGASGNIIIENETGPALRAGFRYINAPVVSNVTPLNGKAGTQVTITGNNFDNQAGTKYVYFGAVRGTITASTNTTISATVPAATTFGPLTVSSNFLTATAPRPFISTFPGATSNLVANSFAPKTDLIASEALDVAMGDFDSDGNPDIVAASASGYISFYRNQSANASLSFVRQEFYSSINPPKGLSIADFDADGKPDLLVGNPASGYMLFFRNSTTTAGSFLFQTQIITPAGALEPYSDFAVGDIDGDGKPDIVAGRSNSKFLSIYRNISVAGQIAFEAKYELEMDESGDMRMAVGDLNGDGKLDLVVANNGGTNVYFVKNTSVPGSISMIRSATQTALSVNSGIVIGDFDADGKNDVAVSSYNIYYQPNNGIGLFKNIGSGQTISFASRIDLKTAGPLYGIATSDLDGDGWLDIAVVNSTLNTVSVYKNDANGTIGFTKKSEYATGSNPVAVALGDLDKDGRPDMAIANQTSGTLSLIRNKVGDPLIVSSGASPVTGVIVSKVTVDSAVQTYNGAPYVQRHYDIEPKTNAATATAQLTLYYSQADFDNYNNHPAKTDNLPATPVDAVGKSVLRIFQYHGTSATGLPGSYTGTVVEINPADSLINWNPDSKIWEIRIDITGFSGFFVGTAGNAVLPLRLIGFTAKKNDRSALVNWSSANEFGIDHFEIERSNDGINFVTIGEVKALNQATGTSKYQFSHPLTSEPNVYYRLKIVEQSGLTSFSDIAQIKAGVAVAQIYAYPNPIVREGVLQHPKSAGSGSLSLIAADGKLVRSVAVLNNSTSTRFSVRGLAPGIYKIVFREGSTVASETVLVK